MVRCEKRCITELVTDNGEVWEMLYQRASSDNSEVWQTLYQRASSDNGEVWQTLYQRASYWQWWGVRNIVSES